MKTSESYTNLQQISPETTGTLGAGTMSSRSRPATGVVLLEEVQESGKKEAPTVTADLVLDGGVVSTTLLLHKRCHMMPSPNDLVLAAWCSLLLVFVCAQVATTTFQSASGYPLVRGMFYDVEVKGKAGDSSFLQVASLPNGKAIADVNDKFFTKNIFSTEGRFGAYGAATDIKVLKTEKAGSLQLFEVTFSALSPGGTESPRHAIVSALQPQGSTDVVMLVASSTSSVWKKSEPALRSMAASLQVARVRESRIARKAKNDYRFEDQGGLNERATDSVIESLPVAAPVAAPATQ